MKSVTVYGALIRAAMAAQGQDDTRYYLNGFLLAANGDIVATDGSMLFKGTATNVGTDCIERDTIIKLQGPILASVEWVSFNFDQSVAYTNKGKAIGFEVVDGSFPNYTRVIPHVSDFDTPAPAPYGFQLDLFARASKCFGKRAIVACYFKDADSSVRIDYRGEMKGPSVGPLENSTVVLMPVTLAKVA